MSVSEVRLGENLQLSHILAVSTRAARVRTSPALQASLAATRAELRRDLERGAVIYGVNTGFGALSETRIPAADLHQLQRNLLRSHAMGTGPILPPETVRALLLLRAHTLSLGASGVSPELVDFLLELLQRDILPVVPEQGSVGASGDLAPLAHLALPLLGEGEVLHSGRRIPAAEALRVAGLQPFDLGPKEGLALINGTQLTTAIGALALCEVAELLTAADIVGALTLDANLGTIVAFDPRIHAGKPHPGQVQSAHNLRALIQGSPLNESHRDCGQVQDAYCLRCMPQVHGSVRQAFRYVRAAVEIEANSMTDNPLVLPGESGGYELLSGGNFHAANVAVPLDHMTAAVTTLATMSERRGDRLCNAATSRGLPAFLADDPGLQSGFMMIQVTAAALASECKSLSFPASVDTIPTSAGKEDHVSMGPIAARKLAMVVRNCGRVLAIEAMIAARALELRTQPSSGPLRAVQAAIRQHSPEFSGDRSMGGEIEVLAAAILRGELRRAAGLASELPAE